MIDLGQDAQGHYSFISEFQGVYTCQNDSCMLCMEIGDVFDMMMKVKVTDIEKTILFSITCC